ncbi:MAG: NAD(P)H-hydrate dehydratase [Candidatus Aenigmarchaeota archaeon]|nr:NAD(P)H-hydrate dehydratase [Candidatus Aenigmarchaeota archaeon]
MQSVDRSMVGKIYPPRPASSRKGDFGKLAIIGGSKLYTGSPALVAMAAIRSGCDLTRIIAPMRAANIAAAFAPDIISYPIDCDFFSEIHVGQVLDNVQGFDAMAIGNGLGRQANTMRFVQRLLARSKLPKVIDADAIHAVAGQDMRLQGCIITPHLGEFAALFGKKAPGPLESQIAAAKKVANRYGCTVLLKGSVDLISDGTRVAVNRTGSPYMAKGGTGDTLAGIAGALLARGSEPFAAACCAAFLNGRAGELAAKKLGAGLLAIDVANAIPAAIQSCRK